MTTTPVTPPASPPTGPPTGPPTSPPTGPRTSTEDWYVALSAQVESAVLPGGNTALVVRPASALPDRGAAGVLWLHWLGHVRNDCSQFLAEALALAARGVVSVLPQGTFPWSRGPSATRADVAEVAAELARVRAALDHLRALPEVAADRTAIVGHDYGAMYALVLDDAQARVVVAAAPDSCWASWFSTYWPSSPVDAAGYRAGFAAFDPLAGAARLGRRLVLQWAERDSFVPTATRELFDRAAPDARTAVYPYDHQLGDAAVRDRLLVLQDALVLDQRPVDGRSA